MREPEALFIVAGGEDCFCDRLPDSAEDATGAAPLIGIPAILLGFNLQQCVADAIRRPMLPATGTEDIVRPLVCQNRAQVSKPITALLFSKEIERVVEPTLPIVEPLLNRIATLVNTRRF